MYALCTWVRVTAKTFSFTPGTNAYYDVVLELSNRSLTASGVGSPGDFPNQPPYPGQEHWWSGTFDVVGYPDFGYSADSRVLEAGTTYTYWFLVTDPTDMGAIDVGFVEGQGDGWTGTSHAHARVVQNGWDPMNTTPYTGTFGVGVDVGVWAAANADTFSGGHPTAHIEFWMDPDDWVPIPPSDASPAPGQWVYGELVTMTGATGTTAFPYAAGSLKVKVAGLPISAASITETDPSTGEFTLAWEPDSDEAVRVDYQGR